MVFVMVGVTFTNEYCLPQYLKVCTMFSAAISCPDDWEKGGNKCYKFFNESKSWDDAEATCIAAASDSGLEGHELRLRELEAQRELETNRLELQRLENETQQNSQRLGQGTEGHLKVPKVPKFTDQDDIDVYLCSFEWLATFHGWDRGTWATRLAANLSGKALEAFARMSAEDSSDYDQVRSAILSRYELTEEAYRKKFRYTRKEHDETFKEWSVKLTGYFNRWLEVEKIFELRQLHETLIMEQLLNACSPDLRMWLEERHPKKLEDMVQLADHYLVAHRKSDRQEKKWEGKKFQKTGSNQSRGKQDDHWKTQERVSSKSRKCCNCAEVGWTYSTEVSKRERC